MVGMLVLGATTTFANTNPDTQLLEQFSWDLATASQLKFTQATSCESLEKMLSKYAKQQELVDYRTFGAQKGLMVDEVVQEIAPATANPTNSMNNKEISSSSTDFSQTNTQKSWVDEPELLKTDGKYFYYYNEKTNKISIVASPLDLQKSTLDPKKVKILKEIAIPNNLSDITLFLAKDRLVLMGSVYSNTSGRFSSERNVVAIYDTSNLQNLKLLKFENLPGSFQDARLIGDQLYVISEMRMNRYAWNDQPMPLSKALSSVEISAQWTKTQAIDCSQISYVLPEDKNLNLDPAFTIISAMNIRDTAQKLETTALLTPSGEIHMSKNSLYLVSQFYTSDYWNCPRGLLCVMPRFRGTTQTLIHKFERKDLKFAYKNTAVVPGDMLTQYSMDEDTQGNFRILTKIWDPQRATNLYVFSPDLSLAGKLENIEPGEEFKSSRYIGDKLYLVTFEQIDPLFVIDLANPKTPTILWELKIPGYSTYLHPLKKEGTKQYLLGIGYSTAENQRGGITNSGVKLSLFEIDYAKTEKNQISIKELANLTQGGKYSSSQALHNPRLFVMDKQGRVTLPLQLSEERTEGQDCSISYDETGKEVKKDCYPRTRTRETFAGLKTFSMTPEKWIQEVFAKDYLPSLEKKNEKRYLDAMRVGYAGDALYSFNPLFADFIFPNGNNTLLKF